jgi:hypothetical protein
LRYLARLVSVEEKLEGPVTVIERNVLGVLREVVQSEQFRADPAILERADVPKGVVARMDWVSIGSPLVVLRNIDVQNRYTSIVGVTKV